ncbi:protein FAM110C-like [Leucoraja erinacea]|uniref:protein FAM110C-like n=1 Tax=Leucoraja erinaceus TaxID=7782 RepID=UPI0024551CB9|nr:protein FAM110C-like [Leucoraja erinacea]
MLSEIAPTASMPPKASVSLPLRLMTKGPSYLRSQMDGDRRGRQSAVVRLAADKAKYLKSQTARGCKVELNGLGSSAPEEGSSSGSGASSNKKTYLASGSLQQSGQLVLPPDIMHRSSSKKQLRPDSLVMYQQKSEFRRGAAVSMAEASCGCCPALATGAATSEGGELAEGTAPQGA